MNKKIAVAMSGGIDSSITALLLKEQGYNIVGITLRMWDAVAEGYAATEAGCGSAQAIADAQKFAKNIGVEHYVVDVQNLFKQHVVANFIEEYMNARTPNPCVACNPNVKFAAMIAKAHELGCDYIATGHYSQISEHDGRYFFTKAADTSKDQSYVLWNLKQEQLKHILFPLGKFKKSEIKEIATERGFTQLAQKRESQEICFIPDDDYRGFLRKRLPYLADLQGKGNFINTGGKILGQHDGYPFYTIGQRKGLRIALGVPAYVIHIDKNTNTITLGTKDDLLADTIHVSNLNFQKYANFPADKELLVKIRYNSPAVPCTVTMQNDNSCTVHFPEKVSAPTPGQSAVFYEGNDVVAGGIIRPQNPPQGDLNTTNP